MLCCIVAIFSQLTLLHSCALGERSSGGIWKFRTSSLKCYVDHSHTMYSLGNIDVRNWVYFLNHPVYTSGFRPLILIIKREVYRFSKKSRSNLKILGARMMLWSKLRTENPQIVVATVHNCRHGDRRPKFMHLCIGTETPYITLFSVTFLICCNIHHIVI